MVQQYLDAVKKCMGGTLPPMFQFLETYGENHQAQVRPAQYPKMPNKECFKNAYIMAKQYRDLTYVEGMAMSLIPVEHAWLIDSSGNVIDPTWEDPGTVYFGVPLQFKCVTQIIATTGYYGVLDQYGMSSIYRMHPDEFLQSIAIGA